MFKSGRFLRFCLFFFFLDTLCSLCVNLVASLAWPLTKTKKKGIYRSRERSPHPKVDVANGAKEGRLLFPASLPLRSEDDWNSWRRRQQQQPAAVVVVVVSRQFLDDEYGLGLGYPYPTNGEGRENEGGGLCVLIIQVRNGMGRVLHTVLCAGLPEMQFSTACLFFFFHSMIGPTWNRCQMKSSLT